LSPPRNGEYWRVAAPAPSHAYNHRAFRSPLFRRDGRYQSHISMRPMGRFRITLAWPPCEEVCGASSWATKDTQRTQAGTRRYQSGEVDYSGHISGRGDSHLRSLLYEAATVILTRSSAESSLRTWGLQLRE